MKKIVFVINAVSNQRCIKRVNEFVERGYNVVAYGFSRKIEMHNEINAPLEIIGEYSNSQSYPKRMKSLWKGVKQVITRHKDEDAVYYLFGLDIAMVFNAMCRKRFIYEESDLAHTYIGNSMIRCALEIIDKAIIKRSLLTVFTSEGFIKYHFGCTIDKCKNKNYVLIPNRLSLDVKNCKMVQGAPSHIENLRIGFVGVGRFKSVKHFAQVILERFPNIEMHFFGNIAEKFQSDFDELKRFDKCFFHGAFATPRDLPEIYSSIDLVLSTYDIEFENVRYAEPNKIYEAIYFETPIIVSKSTFLSDKVNRLGIGYSVDPLNDDSIVEFINSLTAEDLQNKKDRLSSIDKNYALNINDSFFALLEQSLKYSR